MTTEVIKSNKDYTKNLFEYPEKFKLKLKTNKPVYTRNFGGNANNASSTNHSATTATTTTTTTSASTSVHNAFAATTTATIVGVNNRSLKAKSASVTHHLNSQLNRIASAAATGGGGAVSKSSLLSNPNHKSIARRYNNKQVTISTTSIDNCCDGESVNKLNANHNMIQGRFFN
jgi:hypothetical protein